MTIEVEKGVPIPESKQGMPKYPWKEMEVGDSIFVPWAKSVSSFSAHWYAQKSTGKKFIKRAVDGGVRVWRIK